MGVRLGGNPAFDAEKGQFKDIDLNKYVNDPDHKNEQLSWEVKIAKVGGAAPAPKKKAPPKKAAKKGKKGAKEEPAVEEKPAPVPADDFQVEIDSKNIAHIKIANKFWHGERNVTFTVKDPEGASASRTSSSRLACPTSLPTLITHGTLQGRYRPG